jgi:Fe-S cluster assembly protein SufD
MDKTNFTKLFAEFDRSGATPKYQSLRQAARARFQSLPWPTTRTEDWRFTNVVPLLETEFDIDSPPNIELTLPSSSTLRLVFVNGRCVRPALDRIPVGVEIGSLAEIKTDAIPLGQIALDRDNAFTALNTSFLNDGAYIAIHDGAVIESPIEILYLSEGIDWPNLTVPRTLILVGKNAQATLVERFSMSPVTGREGGHKEFYFTNAVTEIALGEGAVLDHIKIQDESTTAYHIANTQIVMAANSNFTTHYLGLGGALVRNEVRVRFDGEHAEATVNGLYLASGKQHLDNFTVIDHAQPNCASHELYKGILNDRAHGVFNGKIFVRKDAQKTDAKQTNKVLLLSDDATINTKPQLEIFADDVKCTHGATVGQLDPVQLFYLQSRGIPMDEARRLLTFAFANDIVNRIKIEAIRDELEKRIVQ